ncbi:hypothetical protein A2768_01285 [Candidatus Roizmanbacteria bacterium RIFCSPHIGHO2_01_FULL_37_16]|nr:MAG: hypothetical protein A2768_01285 [Candidatus Roizmanbacteria bacterium RIFCSPHIGHO2_01_FULL_37_16]OGK24380.1 MAG: hypothetical protein A3D76_01815 [Candidatus Roizmanbacteria bacterium RIFCSPHIGHO2_02_FULL_37_9b]
MRYLKWDKLRDTISDKEISYFSLYDLETLFKAHAKSLSRFISRKTQEGKLTSLKKTYYEPVIVDSDTVLLASKEKALVDYLYFVSRRRGIIMIEQIGKRSS